MNHGSVRPADRIEETVREYGSVLFRICLVMLRSASDAEDAVSDTFLKYMQREAAFDSEEHRRAWLIAVATNRCRDMLRFRIRHPQMDLEAVSAFVAQEEDCGVVEALMTLPEKFRVVLLLHYVEGYRVEEIARMIGKTPSAIKMRLHKGRKMLKETYEKEYM